MFSSVSTRKSNSGWLDRLRTAKGFAGNDAGDLENFLQKPNPDPETSGRVPIFGPNIDPKQNEDKPLFNVVTDVLHELFNFGDNCGRSTNFEKSARKQSNPRLCAFPNSGGDGNSNAVSERAVLLRSGDINSGVKELNERKGEEEGEGDGRDWNLPGFSRTEVTVIDTSYECWKFDKFLFRKKNIWKVRDKKGKTENLGKKKKRKENGGIEADYGGVKKRKVDADERCREMSELPLHENSDSRCHEKAQDKVGKFQKKQDELKSEKGNSSSIVLIKSIPTSKKSGTNISKSCPRK